MVRPPFVLPTLVVAADDDGAAFALAPVLAFADLTALLFGAISYY
jgi:hypothetical protein